MDSDRDREVMERMLELDGLRGRVAELEAENAKLREVLGRASSPVHDMEVVNELLAGGRYRDPWRPPPECGGFQGSGD